MAKKKEINNVKLSAFPEEVDGDGLKWYGEMSYETQMAVLSHYLHADKSSRLKKGEAPNGVSPCIFKLLVSWLSTCTRHLK